MDPNGRFLTLPIGNELGNRRRLRFSISLEHVILKTNPSTSLVLPNNATPHPLVVSVHDWSVHRLDGLPQAFAFANPVCHDAT